MKVSWLHYWSGVLLEASLDRCLGSHLVETHACLSHASDTRVAGLTTQSGGSGLHHPQEESIGGSIWEVMGERSFHYPTQSPTCSPKYIPSRQPNVLVTPCPCDSVRPNITRLQTGARQIFTLRQWARGLLIWKTGTPTRATVVGIMKHSTCIVL